jgi:aminocarboxymuconate-semialdehyde decarboxylase
MATQDQIIVSPVETENDLIQANYCVSEAFGRQTKDAVWMLMNPGWDTEAGQKLNAQTLIKRWRSTTTNKDGNPNTIFLKATLSHPSKDGERKVVGMAIWAQQSYVEGYGDPFVGDMKEALNILEGDDKRFADQMFCSLWKRRIAYIRSGLLRRRPSFPASRRRWEARAVGTRRGAEEGQFGVHN